MGLITVALRGLLPLRLRRTLVGSSQSRSFVSLSVTTRASSTPLRWSVLRGLGYPVESTGPLFLQGSLGSIAAFRSWRAPLSEQRASVSWLSKSNQRGRPQGRALYVGTRRRTRRGGEIPPVGYGSGSHLVALLGLSALPGCGSTPLDPSAFDCRLDAQEVSRIAAVVATYYPDYPLRTPPKLGGRWF